MNHQLQTEIVKLGGDPSDSTWHWFINTGPHGPGFSWALTRRHPPGYVGLEHLRDIITAQTEQGSSFLLRLRDVLWRALGSNDAQLLSRAIQVAAVVGGASELERIIPLIDSSDAKVAADAKACVFV